MPPERVLKKLFLKISQYLQEDSCVGVSFYWKGTLTQLFSCEYSKIFEDTYFEEHLQTDTSVFICWLFYGYFVDIINTTGNSLTSSRDVLLLKFDYCYNQKKKKSQNGGFFISDN